MPFKCCVTGCRGNYKGTEKVHTFSFPKNDALRERWLRNIPRKDFSATPYSRVCHKHFQPDDLIWETSAFDEKNGKIIKASLQRPKLKEGAFPSIFDGCPSYLSSQAGSSRKSPNEKKMEREANLMMKAIAHSKLSAAEYYKSRTFSDFNELLTCCMQYKFSTFWNVVHKDNILMFLNLKCTDGCVKLLYAVHITADLLLSVSFQNKLLTHISSKYNELPIKVSNINEIHEILDHIEMLETKDLMNSIEIIINLMKSLSFTNEGDKILFEFMIEQLSLVKCKPQNRQYSSNTLILASMFYLLSPQAYKFVRQSGNLILPHPSTIHKISSKLNVNPQKETDDMLFLAYAKQKACYLKEHELYVSLMMDEIHIRPFLDYKSGDIVGIGQEVDNLASSAHVFMIQSILCCFKDVVHILPSKKMTAEVLFTVLKKIIVGLEAIGFKVIVVVSDNNSINRRCISLFNNPLSNFVFPHPVDATRPLFYAVDSVHIIKSVRNNWLNQKNPEQAMYFPNFDLSSNNVCTSSFLTLKNMYEAESGNLLKYGYTISRKALWPTNLERQSVKLALQIFNDQTSQGLKELGVKHNLLNFHETSAYIKIFSSWFSIMNVKTHQTRGYILVMTSVNH
ncbi:uncharacterized protein LOC118191504 [Stegodyphus dumicola]|uniref:uncharacterized protein LOC118191504 n=1 Tax=Stegodyphus dumicola TaxID=202533 RepID=UPI0015AF5195|nr:uncharacterized protein LOC118191504 [Stegodyphus dumicola]